MARITGYTAVDISTMSDIEIYETLESAIQHSRGLYVIGVTFGHKPTTPVPAYATYYDDNIIALYYLSHEKLYDRNGAVVEDKLTKKGSKTK